MNYSAIKTHPLMRRFGLLAMALIVLIVAAAIAWFAINERRLIDRSKVLVAPAEVETIPAMIIGAKYGSITIAPYNAATYSNDPSLKTRTVSYTATTTVLTRVGRTIADATTPEEKEWFAMKAKASTNDADALKYLATHVAPGEYKTEPASSADLQVGEDIIVYTGKDSRASATIHASSIWITGKPIVPGTGVITTPNASSSPMKYSPKVSIAPLSHAATIALSLLSPFIPVAHASGTHQGVLHWNGVWANSPADSSNGFWCDSGYTLQYYHYDDTSSNNAIWFACTGNNSTPISDLTASVANVSGTTGSPVTLVGTVSNIGAGPTSSGFPNRFFISTTPNDPNAGWAVQHAAQWYNAVLLNGTSINIYDSYTFNTPGTYYYNISTNLSDTNTRISSESNYNNNDGNPIGSITITDSNISPRGYLDSTTGCVISGWTQDQNAPTQAITAQFYANNSYANGGSYMGQITAGDYRGDLCSALGSCYHAFNYPVPALYHDGQAHSIYVYGIDTADPGHNALVGQGTFTCGSPDLTADALPNTSVTLGQALTVNATVRNIGNGPTGAGFNDIFVTNLSANGLYWNTVLQTNSSALAANGVTNASVTFPAGTFSAPGTYYYDFCADINSSWAGSISESNEGNNCAPAGIVTVTAPASPNLTASLSASNNVTTTAGANAMVQGTISNIGNGATGAPFNNTFWFATDAAMTNRVASEPYTAGIPAGFPANYSEVATVYHTFSTPGTYYFQVCADNNSSWVGSISESNEGDNCSGVQTVTVNKVPGPDITATEPVGPMVVGSVGAPMTFPGTVFNNGNRDAGAFPNVVQVCDFNCATTNTLVTATGVSSLAVNASQAVSGTYTPTFVTDNSIPTKQLVYRICGNMNTSGANAITEQDYTNNCGGWKVFKVNAAIPAPPTGTTATCNANGTSVTLSWNASSGADGYHPRVYGSGSAECTAAGWITWTDGYTCLPAPNDPATPATSVTFPTNPGQSYGWWVHAANVSGWSAAATPPNFTCAGLSDLTATAGPTVVGTVSQSSTFTGTIANSGNGPTVGGFWNVLQICSDASCSGYNDHSQEVWVPTLANGSTAPVSVSASLPGTSGSYVYRFCANNNTSWVNTVAEGNYGNNCSSFSTLTANAPAPTCSISSNPAHVYPPQQTTLTWSSTNTTSCTGSGFSTGNATNGSQSISVPLGSQSYGLTCTGSGGTCNATPTTVISGCGTAAPSITANPKTIGNGATTTLTWSGTSVNTSCVLSGPGVAQTIPANSCSVPVQTTVTNPLSSASKFCVSCDGGAPVCTAVAVPPKFVKF